MAKEITVSTMTDRSNIPPYLKEEGMICSVTEDNSVWRWENNAWVSLNSDVDLSEIQSAISTLESNKANKTDLDNKSDLDHKHSEYALTEHTHEGDANLVTFGQFSEHQANQNENAIHFINKEEKNKAFAIATQKEVGRIKVGQSLYIQEDGTLDVRPDLYDINEEAFLVEEHNPEIWSATTVGSYIPSSLEIYINGIKISTEAVREDESDDAGYKHGFSLINPLLNPGDIVIARYFQTAAIALGSHGSTHLPNGSDPIAFVSDTNGGGLMKTSDWQMLKKHETQITDKLDKSEVTDVATPNKVLRLDDNAQLPASITGNAATSTKLQTARTINGVAFDGTKNIIITADPNAHNQGSNTIDKMTGYQKQENRSLPIQVSDSLNTAIGKIEKEFDYKTNIGHKHISKEINMTDYNKNDASADNNKLILEESETGKSVTLVREGILTSDSLGLAIAKLEKASELGKEYTDARFEILLDGVDVNLDTLKEISEALNRDGDFAETIFDSLALKAPINSPTLTGVPQAPTNSDVNTNTNQIATTAFVQSVASSGVRAHATNVATTSSLGHIKSGNDISVADDGTVTVLNNSHTHLWTNISDRPASTQAEIDSAVDNNHTHANKAILDATEQSFTSILKTKLDAIEEGANKYVLPPASATTRGGVIVGEGLKVSGDGTISSAFGSTGDRRFAITKEEEFIPVADQTEFKVTTGVLMLDSGAIQVFINGVKLPMKDIVEVNDHTIRIPEGLVPTDRVLVRYTQLSDLVGEKHSHNHLLDGGDAIPLATIDSEGLMSKGDKVKLNSIEVNANNYTHPTTHSSEMIVDTAQKRFVTDAEKTKWNAKAEASLVYSKQEVDTKIQTISSTTYTKQEVNIAITNACQEFTTREDVYGKIANNSENFYTKQEIDEKLSIGSESIYTKEQIDEKISGTSDLFYSKAEVDAKIAEIMSIIGQLESKN